MRCFVCSAALAACSVVASAQPAGPIVDLGAIAGDAVFTGSSDGLVWLQFSIGSDILDPGAYLDLTTNGSTIPDTGGNADTEIGLYDSDGVLIATDDDDGLQFRSALSFGTGSGLSLGDLFDLGGDSLAGGEDGELFAGTYYLAIADWDHTFADGFVVNPVPGTQVAPHNWRLEVYSNIPAPAGLALAGLGGLAAARRRR